MSCVMQVTACAWYILPLYISLGIVCNCPTGLQSSFPLGGSHLFLPLLRVFILHSSTRGSRTPNRARRQAEVPSGHACPILCNLLLALPPEGPSCQRSRQAITTSCPWPITDTLYSLSSISLCPSRTHSRNTTALYPRGVAASKGRRTSLTK